MVKININNYNLNKLEIKLNYFFPKLENNMGYPINKASQVLTSLSWDYEDNILFEKFLKELEKLNLKYVEEIYRQLDAYGIEYYVLYPGDKWQNKNS